MGAESIPMMYQGLQLDNPLDHYAKGQALSHMAAQSKLINSQIAEKEQANTLSRMRQQALAGAGGDMDRAKASLMSMGDYAGAHEIEKNQLDTQKTQADISSTNTKNQAALWDHRKQIAAFIADGGTLDHAGMAVDALVKGGDVQGAQWLHGLIQQYPNATPDQIRQAMTPIINMGIGAENRSMPKYEDAGGVKKNINPFVQSPDIVKTQTPDSIASNATTIRGQNMTDSRARELNQITSANGKAPQGYRFRADGNLEAIPGGPADVKNAANTEANRLKQESASAKSKVVMDKVDEALGKVGFSTSGLTGKAMSMIPGTGAYDLDKTVETVKANLGFKELADMRAASPTGGALGQVAVRELEFLQAAVANLDVGQSEAQLRKNLMLVKKHYEGWKGAVSGVGKDSGALGEWTDL